MAHNQKNTAMARSLKLGLALAGLGLAAGCATVHNPDPKDPWESVNRPLYSFNDAVDGALIKPVTLMYTDLTPQPAQSCVRNVFNNLRDVWSAVNSFLQGRGHDFFNTTGRVLFNTTAGLGGCFDIASKHGAHRIPNDLGTTLGVWGMKSGPYMVLPILGPSTVRDTVATAAGISAITPILAVEHVPVRNTTLALYGIDVRAGLLEADRLVSEVALDRYSFVRDAYLQRRDALVNMRRNGDQLPDYSDDLPDYSDDDLPDYEDNDPTEDVNAKVSLESDTANNPDESSPS